MENNLQKQFFLSPVSRKLVEIIEKNALDLATAYLREVKRHPKLKSYQGLAEEEVVKRAYVVYSQLGKWISYEMESEELKNYWEELGRQRRAEGFSLPEIFLSLCLERMQLWLKIQSEGLLDSVLDLYQALELYNRIVNFFDRALYYAIIGYCRYSDK